MPQTVRLKVARSGAAVRQEVSFWHASEAELWVGIFKFDELTPETDFETILAADLNVYESATVDGPLLLSKSIDREYINELMTLEGWENATDAPTLNFQLSEEQMNLFFRGQAVRFHYVVSLQTATANQVLVAGDFILLRSFGSNVAGPAPLDLYYTKTQVDALFAAQLQFEMIGNLLHISNGVLNWSILATPGEVVAPTGVPVEDGTGQVETDGAGNIVHDS
jgi:hypothetical protein